MKAATSNYRPFNGIFAKHFFFSRELSVSFKIPCSDCCLGEQCAVTWCVNATTARSCSICICRSCRLLTSCRPTIWLTVEGAGRGDAIFNHAKQELAYRDFAIVFWDEAFCERMPPWAFTAEFIYRTPCMFEIEGKNFESTDLHQGQYCTLKKVFCSTGSKLLSTFALNPTNS